MNPALEARGVRKHYGSVRALDDVDLVVGEGELVGLLGPNGAGKSTLVKIACGLARATSGSVRVFGHGPATFAARSSFGYLGELFRFPYWLSGAEVLELHQRLAGSRGGPAEVGELLDLVGLTHAGGTRVGAMSKGMQQRLGIAQALIGRPRLLLLDEPTSALDPAGRRRVRDVLEELRRRGVAALLNSHLLSEIELVCDRVVILQKGRVVSEGSPSSLVDRRGVEIETGSGVKRWPDATRADLPRLVAELVESGEEVYEVRATRPTLEDAYLEAVEGEIG